jgi:hypothetical protein
MLANETLQQLGVLRRDGVPVPEPLSKLANLVAGKARRHSDIIDVAWRWSPSMQASMHDEGIRRF